MLRNAIGGGRVSDFPEKKHYEDDNNGRSGSCLTWLATS